MLKAGAQAPAVHRRMNRMEKSNVKGILHNVRCEIDVPAGIEEMLAEEMEKNAKNKNNLSYWFDKIKDCGFKVPETHIIPIDLELFKWLTSDKYSKDNVEKFGNFIVAELNKVNFDTNRTLFVKTGLYSDKFTFKHCKVDDIINIGKNMLDVYYNGMIVGAHATNEFVVREYIASANPRKTIYDGMPLNTEFRVFYDFDSKEVLAIFNYWDRSDVQDSLKRHARSEHGVQELSNFMETIDEIEAEFKAGKAEVSRLVGERMSNVDLEGKWSIDIMLVDGEYYLIDMALAKNSYYYERIAPEA